MSDTAPAALVEITSEVVSAYLARNHVPPAEIPALIASVRTPTARAVETVLAGFVAA